MWIRVFCEGPLTSTDRLTKRWLIPNQYIGRYLWQGTKYDQGFNAGTNMLALPPGRRHVYIQNVCEDVFVPEVRADNGIPPIDMLQSFRTMQPSHITECIKNWADAVEGFHDAGITKVASIYNDMESAWSPWGDLPLVTDTTYPNSPDPTLWPMIVADPQCRANFSPRLLEASPGGVIPAFGDPLWAYYVMEMSDHCRRLVQRAAIMVMNQSGLSDLGPVNQAYTINNRFPIWDFNGWWTYRPQGWARGDIVNPTIQPGGGAYVLGYGHYDYDLKYKVAESPAWEKDWRWNSLLSALNYLHAATPYRSIPFWQSACAYDIADVGEKCWEVWTRITFQHALELGIRRHHVYNVDGHASRTKTKAQYEDQFAAMIADSQLMGTAEPADGVTLGDPIPMDGDSATTGSLTITYEDFMTELAGAGEA